MSWLGILGKGCWLTASVALVGTGAYICQQYTEQHMLAAMLGPGSQAKSIDIHWSKSAACAQDVQFLLPNAKDVSNNSLRLRAEKMWLAFDPQALLKKRFIFPHVIIEDAIISPANLDGLAAQAIVDVSFQGTGPDVEFTAGPVVQLGDDPSTSSPSLPASAATPASTLADHGNQLPKLSMIWVEQLNELDRSLTSERFASGRQVAIDADMLTEKMQGQFENIRQQAQRALSEARDLEMQLSSMDNLLRHEDQVKRAYLRLDQLAGELKQQRTLLSTVDKRLVDLQADLKAQTLEEKQDLQKSAAEFRAPDASEVSRVLLAHSLSASVKPSERYALVLADLIRKPYAFQSQQRGTSIRSQSTSQPEFAAESAKISGTLTLDGQPQPFQAKGRFLLTSARSSVSAVDSAPLMSPQVAGTDQWEMSIEQPGSQLKLSGHFISADGSVAIELSSSSDDQFQMNCRVSEGQVSAADGQLQFHHWLGLRQPKDAIKDFCQQYADTHLLQQCSDIALVVDDTTPEQLGFTRHTADEDGSYEADPASVAWLSAKLESAARQHCLSAYQTAIENLERIMADKLSQQRTLVAMLRRDAEQHLDNQFDQLRRIQATVDSLIEQRTGGYMARQRNGQLAR